MNERDRELEKAGAALLARFAPDSRVRRIRWSRGETQLIELGDGPPLLLVHGGGDGAFDWVPILSELARSRRVLAVDRPGHGLAEPFDYRGVDLLEHARIFLGDILDALDLPTTDIAANAIGGLLATAFALESPQRVSRLALVGASVGLTRDAPLLLRMMTLPLVGRVLGRLLMRNPTRDGNRKFWGQFLVAHPERLDDAFLDVDVAHTRQNLDSILSLLRCVGRGLRAGHLVLGDRWQTVSVPTLYLGGERDVFVRPKVWRERCRRSPMRTRTFDSFVSLTPGTCPGSTIRSESSPKSTASRHTAAKRSERTGMIATTIDADGRV